jgi:hypothetical protein
MTTIKPFIPFNHPLIQSAMKDIENPLQLMFPEFTKVIYPAGNLWIEVA